MRELTMPNEVYIEEFDIHIRPYLTSDEIVAIGQLMLEAENYMQRELTVMVNVLIQCTDMTEEEVQEADLDLLIQSGLWKAVMAEIRNLYNVWDYVYYEEAINASVARFLNITLPNMVDKYIDRLPKDEEWEKVIENLPKSLNEVLNIAKEDGNADIIRGALKMGTVEEVGE